MHLRVRSSPQFPSGLELLTVQADNTEVPNTAAQALWEDSPLSPRPVHLKVLDSRPSPPRMVVQFIEFGYTCIFQESSHGVGQWYLELATDGTCPDYLTNGLRRHPLLSGHLFEILGDRYSQLLALTRILRTGGEAACEVQIGLVGIAGVLGRVDGFTPLMAGPDARLSGLFLMVCGAKSPRAFTLRYRGGLRRYGYDEAERERVRVGDGQPVGGAVSMVAEPVV